MTPGELLAAFVIIVGLWDGKRAWRWKWLLAAVLVVRFVSQMAAMNGSWWERYTAVAFSPSGSLLLWALLTSCVNALVPPRAQTGPRPAKAMLPREDLCRGRDPITFALIAMLLLAERISLKPDAAGMRGEMATLMAVLHTLTIFTAYACQTMVLGSGLASHANGQDPRTDPTNSRLVAMALALQLVGTISGSAWAARAWGAPWSWDPIEYLSMASLIWLATLHLGRSQMTGGWYGLGLISAPLYTILGTAFVRSGLLARASRHGYLASAIWPVVLLSLVVIGLLAWSLGQAIGDDRRRSPRPLVALAWGWLHWLAGLAISLLPVTGPMISRLTTGAWLAVGSWFLARGLMAKRIMVRTENKP